MFKFRKPKTEDTPYNPIKEEAATAFDSSMLWCVEIFDPVCDGPDIEDVPPLLYGPHIDPVDSMRILDSMLEALNAHLPEEEVFTGRVRPIFTGL